MNYTNIKLVSPQNSDYLRFLKHCIGVNPLHATRRSTNPATNRTLAISQWERAVRELIAPSTKCSSRILTYSKYQSGMPAFREIDLVVGQANHPSCFVELKFKRQYSNSCRKSKLNGRQQLSKSYEIAKRRWPNLACINVVVLMDRIDQLELPLATPIISITEAKQRILSPDHAGLGDQTLFIDGRTLGGIVKSRGRALSTQPSRLPNPFAYKCANDDPKEFAARRCDKYRQNRVSNRPFEGLAEMLDS